jgi:hypothetical protein
MLLLTRRLSRSSVVAVEFGLSERDAANDAGYITHRVSHAGHGRYSI